MAGVNETKLTDEEKSSARQTQAEKEKEFAQELVDGLDLQAGVRKEVDKEIDRERVEDATEEEEETSEEEVAEEADQDEEESSDEEAGEESEDDSTEDEEDADPKTKDSMQKRIDELIAKNKRLEAKLASKDNAADEDTEVDAESKKLSKMSVSELKALKSEVKLAWKEEEDPKKARHLLSLEEKIDNAISEAPQRFERQQLNEYQSAVHETADELGEKFTKEAQQIIFKKAGEIFASRPSLQRSVDGQAMAWQLAAEIYKETYKFSAGKSKTDELQRENNKLKKKTSLDVAVRKGNTKTSENERLFHKAKAGTAKDKLAFFKNELNTDSMLPENLRGR